MRVEEWGRKMGVNNVKVVTSLCTGHQHGSFRLAVQQDGEVELSPRVQPLHREYFVAGTALGT